MSAFARLAALVGWVAGLCAAAAALLAVGADHPGSPPLRPSAWGDWVAGREPVDVVAGFGRTAGLVVVAVLLASTLAQLLLELRTRGRSAPFGDRRRLRLAPAFVAALVSAAATTSPAGAQGGTVPPGAGAVMEVVEDSGTGARTSLPLAPEESDDPSPATPPSTAAPPAPRADEWVVQPGDHLWGIAEQVLAERGDADPTDREVHRYWVQLIRANTDRLVDPDNPDLILPGQRMALP